jgi:hypothetical protein
MKHLLLLAGLYALSFTALSQDPCDKRTFISNISLNSAGFFVMTYDTDLLDSLRWSFGDGTIVTQTENVGSGSGNHTYSAPGTYTVTLEQWGRENVTTNSMPFYCSHSADIVIYDEFQDEVCGGDFLIGINGNVVTFSNTSSIQAPSFSSHPDHTLWEFGNGSAGIYLNRLYDVYFNDGTYTACLYYSGFSFNDGGYMFDCETCKTFTVGASMAAITGNAAASVKLFPNPSAGEVTLETDDELQNIAVTDLSGKIFGTEWRRDGNRYTLGTGSLAAGIYMISCEGSGGESRIRFVKL